MSSPSSSSSPSGTSASDALEGFVLLCKSSSGAQVVMVLQLVLKHPALFVFGELLEIESVKQLEHSEHRGWFELLKVFAYGTYADYKAAKGLPELGDAELTKLKQLTLVNMASKQRILPYSSIQQALNVPDLRALEDLIIESMYAGLLEGHLNQKDSTLEITSAMGRDIGPDDVNHMIQQLGAWLESTDVVLKTLHSQVARVQSEEELARLRDADLEQQKTRVVDELKANKLTSPMGAGGGAGGAFQDEEGAGRKKKPSKVGGVLGMFGRR